jgi:hypothetical protein
VDVAKGNAVAASNHVKQAMGKQLNAIMNSTSLVITTPIVRRIVGVVSATGIHVKRVRWDFDLDLGNR